jgi:hypothetical protein
MLRWIGLACLAVLILQGSAALAAPPDGTRGADALLEAFPLDPTRERVHASARPARSEAVRASREREQSASGRTLLVLPLSGALALGVVLTACVSMRRGSGSSRRRRSVPPSQTACASTRQRILKYGERTPRAGDPEKTVIAVSRWYPDIPGRARVRTLELPAGNAPPPPVEWRSVA